LISGAVLHFVETQRKNSLRERLKREALINAARDTAMAAEWFPIEAEWFPIEEDVLQPGLQKKRRSKIKSLTL
jgi:hypothetical protein